MAATGIIHANFDDLKARYCNNKNLPNYLTQYVSGLNDGIHKDNIKRAASNDGLAARNQEHQQKKEKLETEKKMLGDATSCCLQVSDALNKIGQLIPPKSFRRDNAHLGGLYYMGAVDELEYYFSGRYGRGEAVSFVSRKQETPGGAWVTTTLPSLQDRQGILLFRDADPGRHTELWDKTDHVQNSGPEVMNAAWMWGAQRVLFWEVGSQIKDFSPTPAWLQGWWKVDDGKTYYYYFSDQYIVTYTEKVPKSISDLPVELPTNDATVKVSPDNKVVIEWNIAGDGATTETFTRAIAAGEAMNGTSSRYPPLQATKMF